MSHAESLYVPYQAETRVGHGPALVFAPHPDDEVFGCAGAILGHVADGDPVRVIIVTDGAFGAGEDGSHYAKTRQDESYAAAMTLGYGEPIFWGFPDRGLVYGEALVQKIRQAITEFLPALVYAPSWWEIHPDHVALSLAVTEAIRCGTQQAELVLYEVGVPLHANLLLDITASLALKQAAMRCFASQLVQQAYDDHIMALNRYRTYTLPRSVQAAEAYRRVTSVHALPEAPLMSRVNDHVACHEAARCPAAEKARSIFQRLVTRLKGERRGVGA